MTRQQWQTLAHTFLAEAQALLAGGLWGGAYYNAGYAVECGLKACVMKRLEGDTGVFYRERKLQDRAWKHDFADLLWAAGLTGELDAETKANVALHGNWLVVKDWEESRYTRRPEADARSLNAAITDLNDGVLQWIEKRWA